MSNKTGGPAFPVPGLHDYDGMTLRDYFAAKAMQGLISGTSLWRESEDDSEIAECAYAIADGMLKVRKE